jgi:hypothetical protein
MELKSKFLFCSNIFNLIQIKMELNRITVYWKKTLCLDMKRNPDDTWTTLVDHPVPKKKPRRPKKGPFAKLMRQHKKSLTK